MLFCLWFAIRAPELQGAKPAAAPSTSAPGIDPWGVAVEAQKLGKVLDGKIVAVNRGGVLVKVGDLKGFVPFSKLSPSRLKQGHKGDLEYLKGQAVRVKVVQLDLLGPRKEMVLSELAVQRSEVLASVKAGDVMSGSVTGLPDYGAFVTVLIGGVEVQGLVHKSELSWETVMNVDQVVSLGQTVSVLVKDVDVTAGKLTLSMKQLRKDPLRQTLDTLEWQPAAGGRQLPEVRMIIEELRQEEGVVDVLVGRQATEKQIASQELELYLMKDEAPGGGYNVVARVGTALQELSVGSTLNREDMKQALKRVIARLSELKLV